MEDRKYVDLDKIGSVVCSIEEAETTINLERVSKLVSIYTSDNTMITKIKRVLKKNPEGWKCWEASRDRDGNLTGYFFEAPKKVIGIKALSQRKEMSDEARRAVGERFKAMRAKRREEDIEEEDDDEE